jgi:hypothetical protein
VVTYILKQVRLSVCGLLLLCVSACDHASQIHAESPSYEENDMNQSLDESAVAVLGAFFDSDPPLRGASGDHDQARQMVAAPPLSPTVVTMTGGDALEHLEKVFGAENLDEAFLYGDAGSLRAVSACELVSYEGLLSGGVAACIDAEAGAVVAVWITPEG